MGSRTKITYHSEDLPLFATAHNWKKYWSRKLDPFIDGRVIEVGAGIGSSTEFTCTGDYPEWLCLEPDPENVTQLEERIAAGRLPSCCKARCGVLSDLAPDDLADTILYIDVLEHIERDDEEMHTTAAHVRTGGHIIVLSPAFNWLYSPFDKAVGHFRRYVKGDVGRLTVPGIKLRDAFYLDSLGLLLSAANRVFLRASMPTASQIEFWDKMVVPASVFSDRVFGGFLGRTIVMVWTKTNAAGDASSSNLA